MNDKYINAFVESISSVFANFGFGDISSENEYSQNTFTCKYNMAAIIGLSGNIRGNMALSMPYETAKKIASAMMMGMEVTEIDELCVSALGEMTNMICGQTIMELSTANSAIDITPPTIIHGNDMRAVISQVETIVVEMSSPLGNFELNLGLEA